MSELFEQIKGVVSANNEATMAGIELGREESSARIEKLEAVNYKLLEALKELVSRLEHLKGTSVYESVLEQRIVSAKQAIKEAEE